MLLQYFFYPLSFRDMEIVRPPVSGQLRIAPAMKLFIVFEEKGTARIPTKEQSKVFILLIVYKYMNIYV